MELQVNAPPPREPKAGAAEQEADHMAAIQTQDETQIQTQTKTKTPACDSQAPPASITVGSDMATSDPVKGS